MATRGRKPTPNAVKLLKGTRADRRNDREPVAPKGLPAPPPHLGPLALAEWHRIGEDLEALGVLGTVDAAALALYCEMHARHREALLAIEAHGLVVATAAGGLKANPAAGIAAALEAQLRAMLAEFGATPASRSRLKAEAPPAEVDPLAAFLARRKAGV